MPPSLKRWLDIAFMTVVAFLICIPLYPFLKNASYSFCPLLDFCPSLIKFLIVSLIIGVFWSILIKLGGFRFSDVRPSVFFRYPPVWFFGITGTIFYLWFLSNQHSAFLITLNLGNLSFYIGSIFTGIVTSGLLNLHKTIHVGKLNKIARRNIDGIKNFSSIIENPERLLQWLEQESPIANPSQDLFGFDPIAKKLATLLIQRKTRTIGIVGPYGSGKSSLLNLVEHYLSSHRDTGHTVPSQDTSNNLSGRIFTGKIMMCRVDGWGRAKGSIAQQILTIAVRRLSLEIDCLSIMTVPARYREALTGFKSPWATIISALLSPDEDPIGILEKIDMILKAGNMRLIIFLEDLDRNVSDTLIRDEMPSLLDRLHYLDHISFVLAIGIEQHYSSILIRICEHVENIV